MTSHVKGPTGQLAVEYRSYKLQAAGKHKVLRFRVLLQYPKIGACKQQNHY